jgi:hypothetical protein
MFEDFGWYQILRPRKRAQLTHERTTRSSNAQLTRRAIGYTASLSNYRYKRVQTSRLERFEGLSDFSLALENHEGDPKPGWLPWRTFKAVAARNAGFPGGICDQNVSKPGSRICCEKDHKSG